MALDFRNGVFVSGKEMPESTSTNVIELSRGVPMDTVESSSVTEQFAVEIDGVRISSHISFADAIRAGLLLRNEYGDSKIKVRDLLQSQTDQDTHSAAA